MSDLQKWINEMAAESKKCGLSFQEFCSVLETKFDISSEIYFSEELHAWIVMT